MNSSTQHLNQMIGSINCFDSKVHDIFSDKGVRKVLVIECMTLSKNVSQRVRNELPLGDLLLD